jgi:hypothetical protein
MTLALHFRAGWIPLIILAVLAVTVQLVMCLGRSVAYMPDSGNYILYAAEIAERFDFSGINFLRTPGYSLVLAGIFKVFGSTSGLGMKLVQHFFNLITIFLVYKTGRLIYPPRWFAFCCALVAVFSLQLWSYAVFPMTEGTYALLATAGLYCTLLYTSRGNCAALVLSMLIIGLATLVRPQGQHLVLLPLLAWAVRTLFPRLLARLSPESSSVQDLNLSRFRSAAWLGLGCLLYLACITPWMYRNQVKFDSFSMGGMMGQNLYSRLIEYDGLTPSVSSAYEDIRNTFIKDKQLRNAAGEGLEEKTTWRNHWPATDAYMRAQGTNLTQTDKVFMQAAADTLREYPLEYISNTFIGVFKNFRTYEPTFLYIPGVDPQIQPSWPDNYMWDVRTINAPYASKEWAPANYLPTYEEPNYFTDVYTWLVGYYYPLVAFWDYSDKFMYLQFAGFGACLFYLVVGRRRMETFIFVCYLLYGIVVPMLVVPWSPRHRLPMDPVLTTLYFFPAVLLAEIAKSVLPRTRKQRPLAQNATHA